MRADNKAGDDITQYDRLLEAVKQDGHHTGNQHDHRQVLDEADGMHGVVLLTLGPWTQRNSCTWIELRVHNDLIQNAHLAWASSG